MNRNQALGVVGALCLTLSPVTARAYSSLYVFGDSLSDVGNIYLATGGVEPAQPYVNGQFSNGPIWVEDLSQSLGMGTIKPAFAGGTDFAFGGATTGYAATLSSPTLVPTLTQQIGLFLGTTSSPIPSSALYAIWIGSNDVFNIISNGATGLTALQQAAGAAQTEATDIEALAAYGAKDFLVPLVGDLGTTPTLNALGPLASAAGTALALAYDAALVADLTGLRSTPEIKLSYLDTFTLLDEVIDDPGVLGLSNVTSPCYVGPYTGGGTVCATPDTYLFWDALHPTALGQAVIAQAALNVVPEPPTLAVIATGFAALTSLRRRLKTSTPSTSISQ